MAGPSYDTVALIANIKRRCAVPTSQLTYLPQDFTDLATDEMQGVVVPTIMSAREEFFLDFIDVQPSGNEIDIPPQAAGDKLRTVAIVSQQNPLVLVNLPRIDLDVVAGIGFFNNMTLSGFYVQGNKLILCPPRGVPSGTLIRLYFYLRTLALAAPSTYGQVVTVDPNTNTIHLSFLPSSWVVGTILNAVSGTSPFRAVNEEITITSVSSPPIIVDTVEGVSVGDYISLQGYSAVPQILIEAHPWLAQRTATKCLEGLGAADKMKNSNAMAEVLQTNLMTYVSQRVDGSVKKIVNPNGGLRLGAGIWRNGYGYRRF